MFVDVSPLSCLAQTLLLFCTSTVIGFVTRHLCAVAFSGKKTRDSGMFSTGHVPVLDETRRSQTGLQGVSLDSLGRAWRRFGWIRNGRFTHCSFRPSWRWFPQDGGRCRCVQMFHARRRPEDDERNPACIGIDTSFYSQLLASHHPDRELCHYNPCRPLIVRCETGLSRHQFEISATRMVAIAGTSIEWALAALNMLGHWHWDRASMASAPQATRATSPKPRR